MAKKKKKPAEDLGGIRARGLTKPRLLEDAKKAADAIHADTSVEREITISRLEDLREHLDVLIESVDTDISDDARDADDADDEDED